VPCCLAVAPAPVLAHLGHRDQHQGQLGHLAQRSFLSVHLLDRLRGHRLDLQLGLRQDQPDQPDQPDQLDLPDQPGQLGRPQRRQDLQGLLARQAPWALLALQQRGRSDQRSPRVDLWVQLGHLLDLLVDLMPLHRRLTPLLPAQKVRRPRFALATWTFSPSRSGSHGTS